MSKIHLLTEHVCNKIAAGEVVERPSSVVKELVENALDAGSNKISVLVEKAGRKLIQVRDNGEGMDEDDALLCFESHATSKIRNEEDIYAISSFGFRGEAIPSIASVSRFTLRTRRKEAAAGSEITVHAGKFISNVPAGCAPGTEVTVRDLFYNLPVRRKFMRSEATEERHILDCVTNIALANPETAFELKLDGRILISSPASQDLLPRLRDLFGKTFADALIPVHYKEFGISVEGFISNRSFTRNSRSDQRTFVNGRCIEAQTIYRGIREGYGPMLESGRYPAAILFLSMHPGEVDVNVHPAKREVRFHRDYEVLSAVRTAVTNALRDHDPVMSPPSSRPEPGTGSGLYPDFNPMEAPIGQTGPESMDRILESARIDYVPAVSTLVHALRNLPPQSAPSGTMSPQSPESPALSDPGDSEPMDSPVQNSGELLPPGEDEAESGDSADSGEFHLERDDARETVQTPRADFELLGVLADSYLVGTIPGGLVLIDQHAAHERVMFERILKGVNGSLCQKLLLPITLEVARADMLFISRNLEAFEKIGFELEPFGQNTVKMNGIPAAVPQENAGGLFMDILSRLATDAPAQKNPMERIARAACKAAVKAHEKLTREECEALLHQLSRCEQPFSCPHGRPTVLNISLSEIERRFGRK